MGNYKVRQRWIVEVAREYTNIVQLRHCDVIDYSSFIHHVLELC